MPRKFHIPDYTGERGLNQITSWNNISSGFYNAGAYSRKFQEIGRDIGAAHQQNAAAANLRGYGHFTSALMGARGQVGGMLGGSVNSAINAMLQKIKSLGGIQIKSTDLAKQIGALEKRIESIGRNASGSDRAFLEDLRKTLQGAKGQAEHGGWASMGSSSGGVSKAILGASSANEVKSGIESLVSGFRNAARWVDDPRFARAISSIRDEMERAADAAKDASGKLRAMGDAKKKLDALAGSASGTDKSVIEDMAKQVVEASGTIKKNIGGKEANAKGLALNRNLGNLTAGIGAATRYLVPLKRSLDIGNQIFQAVNSRFNQIARTQMGISAERGGFGRQIRGAGINFQDMMSAIGAGRKAGMEDRQVVSQMVSLQENLARARWGEGPLIENMGKWGLSPFDANGNMKSNHEVMIDYSRKLNSITDKMEKLQFLTMQGFRPEQMEYVANYEKEAKRMEYLKANPSAQGVLDKANILDESGMAAQIDAATKIELKRRQILNQNAWDEGVMSGLIRTLHPENWFLNDWTARQQGIKSAQSEMAIKKLTAELERVRGTIKENGKAVGGLTAGLVNFDSSQLQGMALDSGWAMADLGNKGKNSAVNDLRALYSKILGTENLNDVENQKNATAAGVGIGAGLLTAILGLAAVAAAPFTGGASLIAGATALGLGAGVGALTYKGIKDSDWDDGSQKHVDKLRSLKGNAKAIEEYAKKFGLEGITPEMIESEDFEDDAKARKILSGAFFTGRLINAQALTGKAIDVTAAQNYTSDKFYRANMAAAKARGENTLDPARHEEAIARVGTGDQTIGMDAETAYNYIKYGYDENSIDTKKQVASEIGRLRSKYKGEGVEKSYEDLKAEATANVRQKFLDTISPEIYQAAQTMPEISDERKLAIKENAGKEWDALIAEGGNLGEGTSGIKKALEDNSYGRKWVQENIDKWSRLQGKSGYDQKGIQKKLAFFRHLQEVVETGAESREEFSEKKLAEATDTGKLDEQLFPDGKKPFKFLTKEEQTQKFRDFQNGAGKGLSLAHQVARFAMENGISAGEVNGLLKGGTAEEQQLYDASSAGKAEKRKKEREEKEKVQKGLAMSASVEDIASVLKDEGQAQLFDEIRKKKESGQELTKEEQSFLDSNMLKIGRSLQRKDELKKVEDEGLQKDYVPTVEEQAEIAALDAESQRLDEQAEAEEGMRPLAELSDINRMASLKNRGGFSDRMLEQHFGKDRFQQYKDAVARGEIEENEDEETKKRRAAQEEKEAAYDKRHGIIRPGYPIDEEGEASAAMRQKEEGVAQTTDAMAAAVAATEAAAATGNRIQSAGAASHDDKRAAENKIEVTVNGTQFNISCESGDEQGMQKGAENIMDKFAQMLAGVFTAKTSSVGRS